MNIPDCFTFWDITTALDAWLIASFIILKHIFILNKLTSPNEKVIMFFLAVGVSVAMIHRGQITPYDQVLVMPGFMFKKKGVFQLIINTSVPFFFSFLSAGAYAEADRQSPERGISCSWFIAHRKEFMYSNDRPHNIIKWVEQAGLYYGVIANCFHGNGTFTVAQANANSFIDGNHEGLPLFYFCACCVYFGFLLVWIVNGICHRAFLVNLHTLFSLTPLFKCIELACAMRTWSIRKADGHVGLHWENSCVLCDFLFSSYMMIVNTLAVLGWGSFKEEIDVRELLMVSLVCVMFCGSQSLIKISTRDYAFWTAVVVVWILTVAMYITLVQNIGALYEDGLGSSVRNKIRLVEGFRTAYFVILICLTGARFTLCFRDDWDVLFIATVEILCLVLFVIDMAFFLLKTSHVPEESESLEGDDLVHVPVTMVQMVPESSTVTISKLVDPNRIGLAVVDPCTD